MKGRDSMHAHQLLALLCLSSAGGQKLIMQTVTPPDNAAFPPTRARYNLAGAIGSKLYFGPTYGTKRPAVLTYDVSTKTWGNITIPADTGIMSYLDGPTMTVAAGGPEGDHIVFAGGSSGKHATNAIWIYSLQDQSWRPGPKLEHETYNLCSASCGYGYTAFATGVIKKDGLGKPEDRQMQRLNLTDRTMQTVNMKKNREGAGCFCARGGAADGWTFFGGGSDNAGYTDTVEIWSLIPNTHRIKKEWKLSEAKVDTAGVWCGGKVVFAGGRGKKKGVGAAMDAGDKVDVFDPALPDGSSGAHYKLSMSLWDPAMACLNNRTVLIAGGFYGKGEISQSVHLFDTANPPTGLVPVANLTLGSTAGAWAAAQYSGGAAFFNGAVGQLVSY